MENNSSYTNFSDTKDENNRYDQGSKSLPSGNKSLKPIKEDQANEITAIPTEISRDRVESVAEKVEEDTSSKNHFDDIEEDNSNSSNDSNVIKTTDDPETVVRDLEARHLSRLKRKHLQPQGRNILLLAASLHILEGKGITVGYLEKIGFGKHNAEKQLQDARRNGLLIPDEIRKGKQKQYYLSNYKYIMDEMTKRKKDITAATAADKDITLKLLQVLSNREYTYHNIHLETNLCYGDDYELLGWNIPSSRNKQKVKTFKLKLRRKCSIIVSANETVNIAIECTLDPFKLHTPAGLIEFIGSCGQVLNIMQSAAKNRLNVVPPISEWHITQFDYNKDIPTDNTSPTVLSWAAAYGQLKVEHLGTIFQIYPKGLPEMGICTRFEGHYNTKEKNRLEDTLSDIIDDGDRGEEEEGKKGERSPFVTAEEMLKGKNR